jgi:hypothetical protein
MALNEVDVVLPRVKWSEFETILPVNTVTCAVIQARIKQDN